MNGIEEILRLVALYAIPGIFAITLHEAAHGYAARHFGDLTAYHAGRITLNPLKHVDPVGTLLIPALVLLVSKGQYAFGWAKPVPVDFGKLRHPKRDMLWVAAAGPLANLLMAAGWALVIKVAAAMPSNYFTEPLFLMARGGIIVNAVLMVLNLIPLPPLDGGRIAVSLLPRLWAGRFARLEPYGMMILVGLMFLGWLGAMMGPVVGIFVTLVAAVFEIAWIFDLK